MKRLLLSSLLCVGACGHVRPADPAAAPAPWPAETTPPPAREPQGAHPVENATVVAAAAPPVAPPPKNAEIPGPGPSHPLVLPKPERAKLSSGIEVLLVRRPRLPLATIVLAWKSGAAVEPSGQEGIATLAANLLTEGAGKRDALAYASEAERLGARVQSAASWDSTIVSLTTLTRALDPALDLFADAVLRPRFDPKDVERVRAEITTTLLQLGDLPATQAALTGARAIYGPKHRYAELVQGSAGGLAGLTIEQLRAWQRQELDLSHATLIAVGDLEMKRLRPRLERLFGRAALGQAAAAKPAAPVHLPPAPPPVRRVVLVDRPGAAQTEVRAYEPGPPRSSPDYFPLLVLNTIFGGNFSSRLNAKLREEKGYTYGARSDFAFRRDGGPFVAGAPVKTAVTKPALVDLLAELARLREGVVNDRELTLAKQTLDRSVARNFETPPQVAGELAALRIYGLPDDYFATYADKVAAVSAADLARVAKTLHPDQMSLVFVGDEKVIGPEVRAVLGPYEKVGPAAP